MSTEAIALQNAEFSALTALAKQWDRLRMTPVVDDDYPRVRHDYEAALKVFVDAYNTNRRERPMMVVFAADNPVAPWEVIPHISQINLSRCGRWHPLESWSLSDWGVALAGEVGELCNVIKKLNRVRDGMQQKAVSPAELNMQFLMEVGDVYLYLDLLVQRFGGATLAGCVRATFNRVSVREGFPERL